MSEGKTHTVGELITKLLDLAMQIPGLINYTVEMEGCDCSCPGYWSGEFEITGYGNGTVILERGDARNQR